MPQKQKAKFVMTLTCPITKIVSDPQEIDADISLDSGVESENIPYPQNWGAIGSLDSFKQVVSPDPFLAIQQGKNQIFNLMMQIGLAGPFPIITNVIVSSISDIQAVIGFNTA